MNRAVHRVATMCRVLQLSRSGYYAWRVRERCWRRCTDERLCERIRAIHERSGETYGVPRVHAELAAEGWPLRRKRVARLMRELGLQGVSRRRSALTTRSEPQRRPAPDLLEREFRVEAPDRLYVADISYIPT